MAKAAPTDFRRQLLVEGNSRMSFYNRQSRMSARTGRYVRSDNIAPCADFNATLLLRGSLQTPLNEDWEGEVLLSQNALCVPHITCNFGQGGI